jgi:hypothetical protein
MLTRANRLEDNVNSPNQWLREVMHRRRMPGRALVRQLCMDAGQVSRWLNGREKIPAYSLVEIAEMLAPDELDYVQRLKNYEELTGQLRETIRSLAAENDELALFIEARIQEKVHSLLEQDLDQTQFEQADLAVRCLAAAHFATRRMIDLRDDDPGKPFICSENIATHIRYPYNHFMGLLLDIVNDSRLLRNWREDMLPIRTTALTSMRRNVETAGESSTSALYVGHHATHLLAKHGDFGDQEYVRKKLHVPHLSLSAMSRRLAYAGLCLSGKGSDAAEQYLRQMTTDDNFREANLTFDALHYGDLAVNVIKDGVKEPPPRTIKHILRHLLEPRQYKSIEAVEARTLCDIHARWGAAAFAHPRLRGFLQRCLERDYPEVDPSTVANLRDRLNSVLRTLETQLPRKKPSVGTKQPKGGVNEHIGGNHE